MLTAVQIGLPFYRDPDEDTGTIFDPTQGGGSGMATYGRSFSSEGRPDAILNAERGITARQRVIATGVPGLYRTMQDLEHQKAIERGRQAAKPPKPPKDDPWWQQPAVLIGVGAVVLLGVVHTMKKRKAA